MSIISPLISKDVEITIISFLNFQDQVKFSGVSKAAYKVLSNNEHFKGLFNKYSLFGQNAEFLDKELVDKNLEYLCIGYPTNCWKVACCVFQTRNLKFSESILIEYVYKLKNYFKDALEEQLLTIILKPEKLNDADIHAFLSGFEAYRPLCEMHKEKQGTLENHALSFGKKSFPRLRFKHSLSQLNESIKNEYEESGQQIISNIDQISSIIDKELLAEFVEKYANQPLTFKLIFSKASIADTIHRKLKSISLDMINESLARAIFNQNKAILTSENDTLTNPTLEEIEESFATYIFETMINSFANRPLENITCESYENYANDIHCFVQELPLETINELLLGAVLLQHGDEGIKKMTTPNK